VVVILVDQISRLLDYLPERGLAPAQGLFGFMPATDFSLKLGPSSPGEDKSTYYKNNEQVCEFIYLPFIVFRRPGDKVFKKVKSGGYSENGYGSQANYEHLFLCGTVTTT